MDEEPIPIEVQQMLRDLRKKAAAPMTSPVRKLRVVPQPPPPAEPEPEPEPEPVATPEPVVVAAAPAPRPMREDEDMGMYIRRMLGAGVTDENAIIAAVHTLRPTSLSTVREVHWNRQQLRRKGWKPGDVVTDEFLITPAPRYPVKQKAAKKAAKKATRAASHPEVAVIAAPEPVAPPPEPVAPEPVIAKAAKKRRDRTLREHVEAAFFAREPTPAPVEEQPRPEVEPQAVTPTLGEVVAESNLLELASMLREVMPPPLLRLIHRLTAPS